MGKSLPILPDPQGYVSTPQDEGKKGKLSPGSVLVRRGYAARASTCGRVSSFCQSPALVLRMTDPT